MPFVDPFQPATLGSTTVAVTAVAQFFVLPGDGECVEINNLSGNTVFVETTNGTLVATVAGSYPVQPGHCKNIKMHSGDSGVSVICGVAGPSSVIFSRGNGT